jgi:hypothetical protein
MFKDKADQAKYIRENYPEVTDHRIDKDHWDLLCTKCKVTRGFQVTEREVQGYRDLKYRNYHEDFSSPVTYFFRCPVCATFKQWLIFQVTAKIRKSEGGEVENETRYFRVTSLPSEGLEDIDELPEHPASLRSAYRQAVRSMDANAQLAAAAMFRRALQVITRELLGAKPGNLAKELNECVGKVYDGVRITKSFADVGYIVKEAGNQGAHPDQDADLLDFTSQDAADLQKVFMELVSDLFVVPAAMRRAKEEFLARRKITSKP